MSQLQDTGAQPTQATQQMDQRFPQVKTMMGRAQNAHGPERMEFDAKHMQLMQEQIQAMRSMMGGKGIMEGKESDANI